MQEIEYIGEHLLPGRLGHIFVITGFVSALLAILSFRKSALVEENASWLRLSRIAWFIHSFSILAAIGLIFFIMINQYYEYRYVWDHVSDDLPMKYIFSAFWEGQEGSFLLWMFWHVILGAVVVRTAGKWEPGIMTWVSLVQLILVSMIMGIYFTDDFRLGSSPFLLLRETMEAPIFSNPNYLSMIEGNGLNPLLQNYWMTIHPPTLFLGFASVTIPFCFALTGLWKREHLAWLKPAMPWTLFSAAILGLGILMGGAWAYEALSFGGYWAWDPVENMSLVPWIMLLAGLHGNFIARHTGHTLKATYLFYIFSFLLIVYSTFLTRSGILGEESVHAFTEMGLEWQLIGFIGIIAIVSGYFFFSRMRSMPVVKKEEPVYSREFWMFIGVLVLTFSVILISFTTSIPVWNKLIDVYGSVMGKGDMSVYHKAMPLDEVSHHNRFQLWIAVLIALLSGTTLMLRFGGMAWDVHKKRFFTHVLISALISGMLTYLLSLWIYLPSWQYTVLLAAASFGVVTNVNYLINYAKGKLGSMASGLSHAGFAMMLIGILASGLNKRIVSQNRFAQEGLAQGFNPGESAFLIRDMPMYMNGYWVTYTSDTLKGLTKEYEVEFIKKNNAGDTIEHFTTYPNVLYDKNITKVAAQNPSTKRYLDRDVFTYVEGIPPEQQDVANIAKVDSLLQYETWRIQPGDSVRSGSFTIRLDSLSLSTRHPGYTPEANDLLLSASITIRHDDQPGHYGMHPTLMVRKGLLYSMPDQVNDFNVRVKLQPSSLDSLLPPDEKLEYLPLKVKIGETLDWNGIKVTMKGIDRNASHPSYKASPGDIAIHGVLDVAAGSKSYVAKPLYYIRDGSPFNLKAFVPDLGMHVRLERIEPETESFYFLIARPASPVRVPVQFADEAPRNDYIVLKAILFPGINLFWAGSLLMLIGLLIGMFKRLRKT